MLQPYVMSHLTCYPLSGYNGSLMLYPLRTCYNFVLFGEQFSIGNFFRYGLIVSNAFSEKTISV